MNDAFSQHGAFSWCELMTSDVAAVPPHLTVVMLPRP
jgi:hypothetical protein